MVGACFLRLILNPFVGILSAAASQGLIHKWDIDQGLAQCDRFLYVNDDYVRVCFWGCSLPLTHKSS